MWRIAGIDWLMDGNGNWQVSVTYFIKSWAVVVLEWKEEICKTKW